MEIAAESLLALRQAVDNRLTNESVEKLVGQTTCSTDEVLAKLTSDGIIDELIGALRGLPLQPDTREHERTELDLAKRHLLVCVNGGGGFVADAYGDDVVLHVQFKSQRFTTKPAPLTSHPNMSGEFAFILSAGDETLNSLEELLTTQSPLHLLLVKNDQVLSSTFVEWRHVLSTTTRDLNVELKGTNAERSMVIGHVQLKLQLIPGFMRRPIEREIVETQLSLESRRNTEQETQFMSYAKTWWREFLSLRPAHTNRMVKLYANDESGTTHPVFTFVGPIKCGKVLDSPHLAHRFVSSLGLDDTNSGSIAGEIDTWRSVASVIASKAGDISGLAVVLCSLLLGHGLDAYVACGYKEKSPWYWVVTIGDQNEVTLWEPTTTARFKHSFIDVTQPIKGQPKPTHQYKTVDCLFNHRAFYGNIQPDNRVPVTRFDLTRESDWKALDRSMLASLTHNRFYVHSPKFIKPAKSSIDVISLAETIESALGALITDYRGELELATKWDDQLSAILGSAIDLYEATDLYDVAPSMSHFQQAVRLHVPDGHTFKAAPVRLFTRDVKQIMAHLKRREVSDQIMRTRGDNAHHALRVKVYTYAENVVVLWIMLSCRYGVKFV